MSKDRIGFIGLGRMGGPMSRRLLAAGFELTVHDVNPNAMAPFAAEGVACVNSPREVADSAEIVFACIPSPAASREVALGGNGIIHGKAVDIYIEASTIGPVHMAGIAEGLRGSGITLIDAPISGGITGAEAGTLSVVAAGEKAALDRVRAAMSAFARNIFHVAGQPGPAQTAKLINNMLSTTGTMAALEGVVMGAKAGLDAGALVDFINVSTGRNVATMDKIPRAILTRKFGGKITTGVKDLELFIAEAERLGAPIWTAPRALELLREAIAAGYDRETLRVVQFLEERAGGVVVEGHAKNALPENVELDRDGS